MERISLIFSVLFCIAVPVFSGEHSLYYTYTALSKPLDVPGVYEFTALGMLDDRELDYFSSQSQKKEPKQDWMREKMPVDYWDKGTQSRKSKEQWFKVNVGILMERMRHNKTDLHVLQWRHGCVVNEVTDGNVKFLRGVDEYSYDGNEFLSFDDENSRWIAPVQAAEPTKRKWDEVPILNQYTKGYLEKECVDWLSKFMDYGKEELSKHSPPQVYKFTTKSEREPSMLTLTCLATGFYPKDIQLQVRKSRTSLPEHLVTSTGVRPNGDGTYQLRKSMEIMEEDKERYDCYVNHITLKEPIIVPPVLGPPRCPDCPPQFLGGLIGAAVAVVVILTVVVCVLYLLIKKGLITWRPGGRSPASSTVSVPLMAPAPAPIHAPAPAPTPSPAPSSASSTDAVEKKGSDSSRDSGQGSSESSPGGSQDRVNEAEHLLQSDSANTGGSAEKTVDEV